MVDNQLTRKLVVDAEFIDDQVGCDSCPCGGYAKGCVEGDKNKTCLENIMEKHPGIIVPLTPAQERAGDMKALIDSIADTIHHHLYPAQNEYVRNGRSLAKDIEGQIEKYVAIIVSDIEKEEHE